MSKCRFSVIIPTYNAEKSIKKCLDSIIKQKNDGVEIICIDDGSEDKTVFFIQNFYSGEVRLIAQSHLGVSASRNRGIQESKGEYLLFCDADDEYCDGVFDYISQNLDADVILFGYDVVNHDERYRLEGINFEDKVINSDITQAFFNTKGVWPYVWHGVYKRDFLMANNILFDEEMRLGEDLCFQFHVFLRAKSVRFCSKALYLYNHCLPESSESIFLNDKIDRFVRQVGILQKCVDLYDVCGREKDVDFYRFAFSFLYPDLLTFSKKEYRIISKEMRKFRDICIKNDSRIDGKTRIKFLLSGNFYSLHMYEIFRRKHENNV